jgi:acyl dehydratase
MTKLYLEDIAPGQVYGSPHYEMTAEAIKDFALQWDPQPFHLDEEAAKDSFFQGLAASGWHTAAATMRLYVTGEFQPVNGLIGAGSDGLKWHRPVRPGDVLTLRTEVLEVRPLRSKPGFGMVKVRVTTLDANGLPVQEFCPSMVVQARSST